MQKIEVRGVDEAEIAAGKRVFLRTSLNVPVADDGTVSDDFRLKRDLPTLKYLSQQGARIIVAGYFGRDGESLKPVAEALMRLGAPIPMRFFGGSIEEAAKEAEKLFPGECLILENMRREAGEEKNDPTFAQTLANLADIFVDDAFAEAHRPYASNVGIGKLLPPYAGILMQEEIGRLSEARTPPPKAVAFIGGAKFETKEPLIKKLLDAYGKLYIVGALANDFLKARGRAIGISKISDTGVPKSLASDPRISIQTDVVVEGPRGVRVCATDEVRKDECIVDAGPQTLSRWSKTISSAPFVLWNGPLGIYERGFSGPTEALGRAIAESKVRAVVGGGDTLAALSKIQFNDTLVFRSTGGGAMLKFLVGGMLPAIEVLRKS